MEKYCNLLFWRLKLFGDKGSKSRAKARQKLDLDGTTQI